jgi:hypothetical protein
VAIKRRAARAAITVLSTMPEVGDAEGRARSDTSVVDDASQRHLLRRAATVGLLMRHSVNAGVAAVALAEPASDMHAEGRWLLGALFCWSLYRLASRSQRPPATAIDFGFTLAVCLAIPLLTPDPAFYLSNSAPQAIAGTAVISFAVSVSPAFSLPMTVAIAGAYAAGLALVLGWDRVGSVLAVYYFALQWITSSLIRVMLLRVAAAVDRARQAREAAELTRTVDDARRSFEREQLALLHDTAASTLLMVGQDADLPRARLAAQARRDLELLHEGPWKPAPPRLELVGMLRDAVAHALTPARFTGRGRSWIDGQVAQTVVSAAREALNNVDRHARAARVTIEVGDDSVVIADDGVGFDTTRAVRGHGMAQSMTARMTRIGGSATITSTLGIGTHVELRWPAESPAADAAVLTDPDHLIERVRFIYAAAISAYAVTNLVTTVPYAAAHTATAPTVQIVLATVAGVCTVAALPALRGRGRIPVWACIAALLAVTMIEQLLIEPERVGSQADWVQGGIGWCVLPLALTLSTRRAAVVLIGFWIVSAVIQFARQPMAEALINVGLGTGSILGVQLFALAFDGLMRDAAADVHADVEAHKRIVVAERIGSAVAEDYRCRYASLVDNVVPLLQKLSVGAPVSRELQREARAESRRLRALFDQKRNFEHPLMQQLRPAVDVAEARRIDVTVDVGGELPDLDEEEISRLVSPLRRALSADMSAAHVVLSVADGSTTLSVVCRGVTDPAMVREHLGAGTEVIITDDTAWLIVEQAHGSPGGDAIAGGALDDQVSTGHHDRDRR